MPTSIIDTHVHLWNPDVFVIPWLESLPQLNQPFLPTTLAEHQTGVAVEAFVYVEVGMHPTHSLAEAQYVTQLAAHEPRLRGIVAYAPVEHGERMRGYLEALHASTPLLKAIRRMLQGEPNASICLELDFVRGVQLLGEYDLAFELCITHQQLPHVIELVRRCPQVQFILDHIAKPDIKNTVVEPWRTHVAELAAYSNVVCKISGVATEADHEHWTPEQLAPYIWHVLKVFGEDRVMFGSDWPVALQATSYGRWVATLDALTTQLSEAAKRKLWADNARRVYQLAKL